MTPLTLSGRCDAAFDPTGLSALAGFRSLLVSGSAPVSPADVLTGAGERMGDIGGDQHEYEFEPISQPIEIPEPVEAPEPVLVPA